MQEYSWKRRLAWIFLQTGTLTIVTMLQALVLYPSAQEWLLVVVVVLYFGALIIPHWLLHRRWFRDYRYRGSRDYGISDLITGPGVGYFTVLTIMIFIESWLLGLLFSLLLAVFYCWSLMPSETSSNPRWAGTNIAATTIAGLIVQSMFDRLAPITHITLSWWMIIGMVGGLVYSLIITTMLPWVMRYQREE